MLDAEDLIRFAFTEVVAAIVGSDEVSSLQSVDFRDQRVASKGEAYSAGSTRHADVVIMFQDQDRLGGL